MPRAALAHARFVQQEYQDVTITPRQAAIDFIDTYSRLRRAAFTDNDGFDVSFPTASVEDQEFSFRLVERGYHLIFVRSTGLSSAQFDAHALFPRNTASVTGNVSAQRHPGKAVHDSHTPQL